MIRPKAKYRGNVNFLVEYSTLNCKRCDKQNELTRLNAILHCIVCRTETHWCAHASRHFAQCMALWTQSESHPVFSKLHSSQLPEERVNICTHTTIFCTTDAVALHCNSACIKASKCTIICEKTQNKCRLVCFARAQISRLTKQTCNAEFCEFLSSRAVISAEFSLEI